MSTEDLKAYFSEALPDAGYQIASTAEFGNANGSYVVMTVSGHGIQGTVYLGSAAADAAPGYEGDFDFLVTLAPGS
jgi:hypothetical protein